MGKNEYYLKQIGARIMKCRKEKGYQNREEFAKLLGISSNTLRNYENGVREIGTELLLRISMLLGVSTDRLLCKDEKSASTEAEARIEDLINSQRGQALLSKYSVLTEPAQGRVDATVNDIWSNPVNRIDQQPQEPSTNARTIEYAAWGVGPTTSTVNVDEETLRAAEEDRLRRQADRLMAERDRAAAAKKGFGRKRKK